MSFAVGHQELCRGYVESFYSKQFLLDFVHVCVASLQCVVMMLVRGAVQLCCRNMDPLTYGIT